MADLPYHDECECACHRQPGMMHIQPCCRPRPPHDNEAPEVIQGDKDAAYAFTGTGYIKGSAGIELLAQAFARHRLAFASLAEPAPRAGGGEAGNYTDLISLLHREGKYSGVWFGDHLIAAADLLDELTKPSLPAGREAIAEREEARCTIQNALMDSQYLAGVSAGWNAAHADDPESALARLKASREGHLAGYREAKALLAIGPSVAGSGEVEFELWQGDERQVGASGPRDRALAEIMHYAAVYGKDGPVEVFEVIRKPVALSPPSEKSETK